jgi:hypothetical protein
MLPKMSYFELKKLHPEPQKYKKLALAVLYVYPKKNQIKLLREQQLLGK